MDNNLKTPLISSQKFEKPDQQVIQYLEYYFQNIYFFEIKEMFPHKLKKQNSRILVEPQSVQGDCSIIEVFCLDLSIMKIFISMILSILSLGTILLIAYWSIQMRLRLFYKFVRLEDSNYYLLNNWDFQWTIVKRQTLQMPDSTEILQNCFQSRYHSYFYRSKEDQFQCLKFDAAPSLQNINFDNLELHNALDQLTAESHLNAYGQCQLQILVPSVLVLFIKECIHPFFVFQAFSCTVWFYEEYEFFAYLILILTIGAAISNLIMLRKNIYKLSEMALHTVDVNILRKGEGVSKRSSAELVPGDIFYLKDDIKVPCDCVLLEGSVLIDESVLTGQSVPVIQNSFDFNPQELFDQRKDKKSILYEGTRILQMNAPIQKTNYFDEMPEQQENSLFQTKQVKQNLDFDRLIQNVHIKVENQNLLNQYTDSDVIGLRAMAIATGFSTFRGQMIRSILYPESLRYLAVITVLTFIAYGCIIPHFVGILSTHDIIMKFLVIITISIPPALPAALQIGINFSVQRIEKKRISCISPPQVIVGGRVDTVCFDKTGTLTQDQMQLRGLIPCLKEQQLHSEIIQPGQFDRFSSKNMYDSNLVDFIDCITVCHSLTIYKQRQEEGEILGDMTLGDPMEQQLFNLTGGQLTQVPQQGCQATIWKLNKDIHIDQNDTNQDNFGILQRYQFLSQVQRMSVVAQQNEQNVKLYLKGAPEVVQYLCDESTVPENFSEYNDFYANKGFRILAMAVRDLEDFPFESVKNQVTEDYKTFNSLTSNDQSLIMSKRSDMESKLRFLGFVLFENPIKSDSIPTINSLNRANLSLQIVTGDNALTAASVARQCAVINEMEDIVIMELDEKLQFINILRLGERPYVFPDMSHVSKNNNSSNGVVEDKYVFPPISNKDIELGVISSTNTQQRERQVPIHKFLEQVRNYPVANLCLTGPVFQHYFIQQQPQNSTLQLLAHIQIFARMKPNHKKVLIYLLQQIGKTVAMVGDGANDCGALKQADIGLSLSDAEASISAPFTSRDLKVYSIVELLIQSRAGLATSFQCFQFMTLYSMIQFSGTMIQFLSFSQPSQIHYLYQDLFIVSTLFVTMNMTQPEDSLSVELPEDKLLSVQCMFSILSQIFFETISQFFLCKKVTEMSGQHQIELNIQIYHETQYFNDGSLQATSDFIFQNFIFLGVILAFTIGHPFKKPFYTNAHFTIALLILWLYQIAFPYYQMLQIPGFQINKDLSGKMVLDILILSQVYMVLCYVFQQFISIQLIRFLYKK